MKIVIDPKVLRNAQQNNGYGRTLSHVLNKAQYYCHVYTEELRAEYGCAAPTGQGTAQNTAAQIAKALYLSSTRDRHANEGIHVNIKREIIVPLLTAEDACGDAIDCQLTETDRQLVRVAKSVAWEIATALESGKIVILTDCSADLGERCLCQAAWTDLLIDEVPGAIVCHADDHDSLAKCLQKDIAGPFAQHQARFELECGRWLDRTRRCYGQINFKWGKTANGRDTEYEQDYFCDTEINGVRHVYVGECKLFDGANKFDQLCEGIGQLDRAVRHLIPSEPKPARIECFLFSNSSDLADRCVQLEAEKLASNLGVAVRLLRVTMPDGWKRQSNWLLRDEHYEEVCLFTTGAGS